MTGVLVVQDGDSARAPLQRIVLPHVPVGHELHAVGVHVYRQQDHIIQDPQRLRVRPAHHPVHHLHELLGTENLRSVEATVDPDHGLALLGQRPGLLLRDPLRLRQAS